MQPTYMAKPQQIIGYVLYYARDVYGTFITTLNKLASAQTEGTQATMQATKNLMNYCHTHSDITIRYCASQMQLHTHSYASYLSSSK